MAQRCTKIRIINKKRKLDKIHPKSHVKTQKARAREPLTISPTRILV